MAEHHLVFIFDNGHDLEVWSPTILLTAAEQRAYLKWALEY